MKLHTSMRNLLGAAWLVGLSAVSVLATDESSCPKLSEARERLECPDGTQLRHSAIQEGYLVQCQTAEGVAHGPMISYWVDDQVAVIPSFRNGKQEGLTITCYRSGSKRQMGKWRDGQRIGEVREWNENGVLVSVASYVEGVKTGEQRDFYDSGELKVVAVFEANVQHGLLTAYHRTGAKMMEGQFDAGQPHGRWTTWDESGTVTEIIIYERGTEVSRQSPEVEDEAKPSN